MKLTKEYVLNLSQKLVLSGYTEYVQIFKKLNVDKYIEFSLVTHDLILDLIVLQDGQELDENMPLWLKLYLKDELGIIMPDLENVVIQLQKIEVWNQDYNVMPYPIRPIEDNCTFHIPKSWNKNK